MKPFSINDLVYKSLDEWDEPDPHVIASRLISEIPSKNLRTALTQCLPDRIRIIIGQQRHATPPINIPKAGPAWTETFVTQLKTRHWVDGQWKRKKDLTADDCDWLADDAIRQSNQLQAVAATWRDTGEHIRTAGVSTFGELIEAKGKVPV